MKTVKLLVAGLLIAGVACIYSCKKNDTATTTTDNTSASNTNQVANDETMTENESNQALDDANNAMSKVSSVNGRVDGIFGDIHGAAVVTKDSADKKITITYDGTTVWNGKVRSGVITLQLTGGMHWSDKGAVLTLTFTNFQVTRKSDGASITINGTHVVTNTNGGRVGVDAKVVHDVTGTMNMLFSGDGKTRTWTVSRTITYTINAGVLDVSVAGSGVGGIVLAGTDRNGESFTVTITTPLQANSSCGFNAPTAGVRTYTSASRTLTLTLGLDDTTSHNAVTGSNCATYFKVDWILTGKGSGSAYLPY